MKTDRELLELAAKASGELTASWYGNDAYFDGVLSRWNPLNDDGDALRLAVKLRLTVSWDRFDDEDYATATPPHTHQGYDCMVSQDPYAATRRAITRAAAAIGEGE
jgi:hypothetical protein